MSSVSPHIGHADECDRCLGKPTLCRKCKLAILPQLAQPAWIRLIGANNGARGKRLESKEGRKIRLRKERKALRKLGMLRLIANIAA